MGQYGILIVYAIVLGGIFLFVARSNKKKKKTEENLRNNIQPGDVIITIGGIYGKVVSVKDDSLFIESLVDHSKLKITKWAVSSNTTIHEDTEKKV